jgi:hypothetical protein
VLAERHIWSVEEKATMSALVFVDVLSYLGACIGVAVMFFVGFLLMRPGSATKGLAAFIGEEKALECVRDGSFKPSQARALGTLLLIIAVFLSICILRGVWH